MTNSNNTYYGDNSQRTNLQIPKTNPGNLTLDRISKKIISSAGEEFDKEMTRLREENLKLKKELAELKTRTCNNCVYGKNTFVPDKVYCLKAIGNGKYYDSDDICKNYKRKAGVE